MAALELVAPAGSPAMLRAAIEAGADAVYCGLRDETNARNFPGLNFSSRELRTATDWAHAHGAKVFAAINTYAHAGAVDAWRSAVDCTLEAGVDALILADIGVLAYARAAHPQARLHLSVQASAGTPEAIAFYVAEFGVKRVVLPRVLTLAEITALRSEVDVEIEVFAFGGMCVMAEGRCALSSYVTGRSPNLCGVCSPAEAVSYIEHDGVLTARLGAFALDRFAPGEPAGYPTLCKARLQCGEESIHLFEEPVSLNAIDLLADFQAIGVAAIKLEGRQRGTNYVATIVRAFREALDGGGPSAAQRQALSRLSEGGRQTDGAYRKQWR